MNYPFLGHKIAAGVVVALIAAACGSSTATSDTSAADTTPSEQESSESSGTEVTSELPIPTIAVSIEPDAKAGQNLTVEVTDFTISPEAASTETVDGEGHFHLYVDGERTMRFYNESLHLNLDPGSHEIMVELSSNDHSAWTIDGEPIVATASIDVETSDDSGHNHSDTEGYDVAGFESIPSVEVMVVKDPKSGWNVHAPVENFALSAENASGDPVDGEGHLHLMVDGDKAARLYGSWWHIPNLDEGEHDISVELRGNDHAPLTLEGEMISASTSVSVSADEAAEKGHHHGDDEHSSDGDESTADAMKDGDGHGHGESSGSEAVEDGLKATDAEVAIEFTVSDGDIEAKVDGEVVDGAIDLETGAVVSIQTTSDVADQVHLHGHDILVDVAPDADGLIVFTADIPGSLEVEMEGSGTLLANLRVS